jgi:hypothetical protein
VISDLKTSEILVLKAQAAIFLIYFFNPVVFQPVKPPLAP